ncbi:MAG: tRNA epoxyqueuosine(34) reductase QueG [Pirellulales bacterium]
MSITKRLKQAAADQGFALAGVCAAVPTPGYERLVAWLTAGYAGQMHYLETRREAYAHPQSVLAGVRSLLMLGWNYATAAPEPLRPGQGRISRYAWGDADYHEFLRPKLHHLADLLRTWSPGANVRGVVDTAPLLERDFAQLAGLGWVGKHTLLLNRQLGSWFFLAALLTDVELDADPPWETDHCGSCRACLDACPTQAFPAPYVLDASRCISYLTIELREPVPESLRAGLGDWLFGCDVCQDVCPWNRRAPRTTEAAFQPQPDRNPLDLVSLLDWDEAQFRAAFRETPLWRARRRGLLRNAAYVLGNQRPVEALPALIRRLDDEEPLVRGAVAWALGQYRRADLLAILDRRSAVETDEGVSQELQLARAPLLS